jgi:hypothetical protein
MVGRRTWRLAIGIFPTKAIERWLKIGGWGEEEMGWRVFLEGEVGLGMCRRVILRDGSDGYEPLLYCEGEKGGEFRVIALVMEQNQLTSSRLMRR